MSSESELDDGTKELEEILREYRGSPTKNAEEESKHRPNPITVDDPVSEWIKSEEEIRLEKLVFGDKDGLLENLQKSSAEPKKRNENTKKRKPAWSDEDDEEIVLGDVKKEKKGTGSLTHLKKDQPYKEYLRTQYKRFNGTPNWANLDREVEPDSDEEILRTVGFIKTIKSSDLPPNQIQIRKLKDLNRATYAEGSITNVQFHPTSTAAMVSGENGISTIYTVDGLKNEKIHSIHFENFPIITARILPCGTQSLFSSKSKYYYTFDFEEAKEIRHVLPNHMSISFFEISPCGKYFVAKGRFGEFHLFDGKSKEFIRTFKQEEDCRAMVFSLDSTKLFTASAGSTVNVFDLKTQRHMHSFIDEGCIKGHCLALSPNGKMLATGTCEGVVNIYDYEKALSSRMPRPEKTILNLRTKISHIKFNHSSEMLAMCSAVVPAGVKLVHFPSGTVFSNFPLSNSNLRNIKVLDFSPSSGYLALGSTIKTAPLFRLKHFENY